jgi:hypothetical protein
MRRTRTNVRQNALTPGDVLRARQRAQEAQALQQHRRDELEWKRDVAEGNREDRRAANTANLATELFKDLKPGQEMAGLKAAQALIEGDAVKAGEIIEEAGGLRSGARGAKEDLLTDLQLRNQRLQIVGHELDNVVKRHRNGYLNSTNTAWGKIYGTTTQHPSALTPARQAMRDQKMADNMAKAVDQKTGELQKGNGFYLTAVQESLIHEGKVLVDRHTPGDYWGYNRVGLDRVDARKFTMVAALAEAKTNGVLDSITDDKIKAALEARIPNAKALMIRWGYYDDDGFKEEGEFSKPARWNMNGVRNAVRSGFAADEWALRGAEQLRLRETDPAEAKRRATDFWRE